MYKKFFHASILILLLLFPQNLGAEENFGHVPMDHRVKAAFLCKFIKYMDWPSSRIVRNRGEFIIGVFGESPITGNLVSIMPKVVDGWKLKIIKIKDIKQATDTHMLFLSLSEKERFPEIIHVVKDSSVLTVSDNDLSDSNNFLAMGGIVNLYLWAQMVRFEINLEAAEAADIKISSKLLTLAKKFNTEPKHQN